MRNFSEDRSALALNTATLGHNLDSHGAGWSPDQVIDACAARGFGGITFWRREIGKRGDAIGRAVRSAGMQVTGLCRSPFLTGPMAPVGASAVADDFKAAIDMTASLGAPVLTIVVGGIVEGSRSMADSLARVADHLAEALPYAEGAEVILALEPLNPVYAGDRSCLVTVRDAVNLCERLDAPNLKIAVDVYHVWWDLTLGRELARAGKNRIAGFHLCDWLASTTDVLLDRGMMGDGVADIKGLRGVVESAGYTGFCEVEIFSVANWWQRDPEVVLDTVVERFHSVC